MGLVSDLLPLKGIAYGARRYMGLVNHLLTYKILKLQPTGLGDIWAW